MIIVWDEPKRVSNLVKHGLDFAALPEEFFLTAQVLPAKGGRLMAIGTLGNATVAVIFATLGAEGITIISMRRAGRKERDLVHG